MTIKSVTSVVALILMCTAAPLSSAQTRKPQRSDNSEWMFNRNDDGKELRARIKGRVEFAEDYSDVTDISRGGRVWIKDTRNVVARRIEIEPDASGALRRSYFVDDKAHEFDGEARRWLAEVLLEMVRESGFDAAGRVRRLFERGGAAAVLAEISQVNGDYSKGLYFRELLNQSLDSPAVGEVVRRAAGDMKSSYEKNQVLSRVAEKYSDDKLILAQLIDAIATIDSTYERSQTLSIVLKKGRLNQNQINSVLQGIAGISSDYEKGQLLKQLVKSNAEQLTASPRFLSAIEAIHSDYEREQVLLALLEDGKLSRDTARFAIKSALSMSSDYEKARVLIRVAELGKGDEEIRKSLIEAARAIGSEYERGRVLSATFR